MDGRTPSAEYALKCRRTTARLPDPSLAFLQGAQTAAAANHAGEFAMKSNFRSVMVIAAIAMLTMGAAGCKRAGNSGGASTDACHAGAMCAPSAPRGRGATG